MSDAKNNVLDAAPSGKLKACRTSPSSLRSRRPERYLDTKRNAFPDLLHR